LIFQSEVDIFIVFFAAFGLILLFLLIIWSLLPSKAHKTLNLAALRRLRHAKTTNPNLEAKLLEMFLHATDEEFENKFEDYSKRINYKFRYKGRGKYHSTLKRSVYNVINKYTNELPRERIDKYLAVFPLLKRVYFGPKLTRLVYSENLKKQKFHFTLKDPVPKLDTIIDVALFFGTTVNVILGYCYSQDPSNRSYYRSRTRKEFNNRFYKRHFIMKKNGHKRLISVPRYRLKIMQRKILHDILDKAVCPACCNGFLIGKSIVDNASPHLAAATLIKMDLQEFFPSLKFGHVFQVFRGFGYSRPVAGVLACLSTDFFKNTRFAPQGAPTSPMIANLYASHLDARLNGLWSKHGFNYSRYADDITLSSKDPTIKPGKWIHATYEIMKNESLKPNYEKTKVFRRGHQLKVTGVVVNDKLNVDRAGMHTLRAEVHHLTTQERNVHTQENNSTNEEMVLLRNQVMGKIAFLNMINPDKAQKFKALLQK